MLAGFVCLVGLFIFSGCGAEEKPVEVGLTSTVDESKSPPNTSAVSTPTPSTPVVEAPPKNPDPVTIKLAMRSVSLSEEELERYVTGPVSKKYPHITVERIDFSAQGQSLPELVAARNYPDVVAEASLNLGPFLELGLDYDLDELVKKHQMDLNRFHPGLLEAIQVGMVRSDRIGLPLWNQAWSLAYNKNLFDRFGVDYPQDGMTWDEARDIAVSLTRTDNGISYYGLYADNVFRGAYQLGLPWGDWDNNKAVFQTSEWKELFEYWYGLYSIPGFAPKGVNYNNEFLEGRVAMRGGSLTLAIQLATAQEIDWDVVTYPTNPKAPGVGQRVDDVSLLITRVSEHKDAAFQVISVMLSEEVQRELSRYGRMSSLKDSSIHDEFGKNIPGTESKNMVAFTKLELAPLKPFKYTFTPNPASLINTHFNSVLYDGVDINTALRNADEQMNQMIRDQVIK